MSESGMFPSEYEGMKQTNIIKMIEFKELIRIFKMMLGNRKAMKVQLKGSLIEQCICKGVYYLKLDMKSFIANEKGLDLSIMITMQKLKELKQLTEAASEIAIYETPDGNFIQVRNAHMGVTVQMHDESLDKGPLVDKPEVIGIPVTMSWNTLRQFVGNKDSFDLIFFEDNELIVLEQMKYPGPFHKPFTIRPENLNKLMNNDPVGIMNMIRFPQLVPNDSSVTLTVITALDRPWLKIDWPMYLKGGGKSKNKVIAETFNALFQVEP